MPKRRLQCGSCGTVIKVSSRIYRPVCPRCQTAHTFIKCGRAECGTLMCLPENVNQFSCPRCNVQLARPGHASLKSNPMAVRCGNMTCDFLMTIPGNVGRFRCPRCQMEQVLPGTEEALKCKARYEEEMRQKALKLRHQDELRGLCEIFYTMESSIVEAVYESCDKQRGVALEQIMDMVGDTAQLEKSLRTEALRLNKVMLKKRRLVESSMRCPISRQMMTDPVLASDGYTYERASIVGWLATKSTSPATGEELDKNKLVPNHQLRSEIQTWAEYKESEDAGVCGDCREADGLEAVEAVIPAVTSRPASAAVTSMVVEARNVTPHRTVQGQEVDDVEAGAAAGAGIDAHGSRGGGVGIVASMVRALSDLGGPAAAGAQARSPPK